MSEKMGNTDSLVAKLDQTNMIAQGAEAKLYKALYRKQNVALKIRPKKAYRVDVLDRSLRRQRTRAEIKALEKAAEKSIPCPKLIFFDRNSTSIIMEWLDGPSLKQVINEIISQFDENKGVKIEDNVIPACNDSDDEGDELVDLSNAESSKMYKILAKLGEKLGKLVAKLHNNNMVHRDITTSNLLACGIPDKIPNFEDDMDRVSEFLDKIEVTFIDFGLAAITQKAEDRAVDLYVLERAWISTHPAAADVLAAVWKSYFEHVEKSDEIQSKLSEVRQRGRKRSMMG